MYPYIITNESATVVFNGEPHTILEGHPNYADLLDAINDELWEFVPELMNLTLAVTRYVDGKLTIENGQVAYAGVPLHSAVTERLMLMMREGLDVEYLVNFIKNVCENPDSRAVSGLYEWIEKADLPLSKDGCILAYKIISDDYKDCYTGTLDNSIGKTVEIPRFDCDPDPDRTCSKGLHFCSAGYLPHFGWGQTRVVLLKINPKDVVAFPHDYNISKGRCSRYEVIQEIAPDLAATYFRDSLSIWEASSI